MRVPRFVSPSPMSLACKGNTSVMKTNNTSKQYYYSDINVPRAREPRTPKTTQLPRMVPRLLLLLLLPSPELQVVVLVPPELVAQTGAQVEAARHQDQLHDAVEADRAAVIGGWAARRPLVADKLNTSAAGSSGSGVLCTTVVVRWSPPCRRQ